MRSIGREPEADGGVPFEFPTVSLRARKDSVKFAKCGVTKTRAVSPESFELPTTWFEARYLKTK